MESTINAYLDLGLFDESENVYGITEAMDAKSIDDGYRIDRVVIENLAEDYEIDFTSSVENANFIVFRTNGTLLIKLDDDDAVPLKILKDFPTVLCIHDLSKIYVSNEADEQVALNMFVARMQV